MGVQPSIHAPPSPGVMKRWGFKGLPASHGVSLAHRSPGSIGNRKDPGRVWKGKKLPGHMGDERRTVHNCLLYKVGDDVMAVGDFPTGQVDGIALGMAFSMESSTKLAVPSPKPSLQHVKPRERFEIGVCF